MIQTRLSQWRAIALCCVPAVILAAIVGIGVAISGTLLSTFFSGPLAMGMIVLALLICPLHMGWTMWQMQKQHGTTHSAILPTACCPPQKPASNVRGYTAERLQALRAQRQALEEEVTALQQARQH